MKRVFLSLAFATLILSSAIAADNQPSYAAKQAFEKEFAGIKEVKWQEMSKRNGIYVASFVFNSETLQAIFTEEGEFLGTTRAINKEQLPILVLKELNNNYTNNTIINIYEHSAPEGLNFYITVSDEKGEQLLKATGNGQITTHKRSKR
jgi:hypothetical protein